MGAKLAIPTISQFRFIALKKQAVNTASAMVYMLLSSFLSLGVI